MCLAAAASQCVCGVNKETGKGNTSTKSGNDPGLQIHPIVGTDVFQSTGRMVDRLIFSPFLVDHDVIVDVLPPPSSLQQRSQPQAPERSHRHSPPQ